MQSRTEKNRKKQENIEEEEKREKRKKQAKCIFTLLLILFILFSSSYLYITYIATKKIIVKEKVVISKDLPDNFIGKKLIHFSDLHYGSTIFISDLENIVAQINKRNPDLVVFTGDLIDEDYDLSIQEIEEISKQLKKIKATLGKYAVSGEEDDENFQTIMNQSNFSILNNDYDLVYNNDANPILIVGLNSLLLDRNIDNGFRYFNEEGCNPDIYTIALLHEPDSIDAIKEKYKINLALAGHSHNGGIRLPLLGGLNKEEGAYTYYENYYKIDQTELYISSGLGTSNYQFRLFNHPSINFFRLRK